MALTLLGLLPSVTVGQSPTAIMSGAAERFSDFDTFCADFQQSIEVVLLGESRESEGTLCQQPPNLFAMDFSDPEGDRIISDGSFFWAYYPSVDDKQVIQASLEQGGSEHDFFRRFLENPEAKYEMELRGSTPVGGRTSYEIDLLPIANQGFRTATVWVDLDTRLITRLRIEEENSSIRTVTLHEFRENPSLPDNHFTFSPPPGVHVIVR